MTLPALMLLAALAPGATLLPLPDGRGSKHMLLAALAPGATVTRDIEYVKRGTTALLLDASVPDGAGPFPAVI